MAGRASVFSDDTIVQLLSEQFVPVAENSSWLERQPDDKGEFFRHVVEHGHFAGRTHPTRTRQGSYTFLADGRFLASINSRDPNEMATMMHTALTRHERPQELGDSSPVQLVDTATVPGDFPSDGLVLQAAARDLPRTDDMPPSDTRWNLDYIWIRRDEARTLVPEPLAVGERRAAPWPVMRRLARFHLRDFVRGEPFNWPEEAIEHAVLESEIVEVTGSQVRLALRGSVRIEHLVEWFEPQVDEDRRSDAGYDCALYGEATWDEARGAFTAFELVATGQRWGANQYNNRLEDQEPAPMGIAFVLAGTTPRDRTPPHCLRVWRPESEAPQPRVPSRWTVDSREYFG